MDRITGLAIFVAAVEEGSIAAAGKRFGLSAVMAGRYLSGLEERLSVRLVHRTTRHLSLTDAGRAYYVRSKGILEDLQEADDEAADRQTQPRGALHVTAPITFGSEYLAPVLADYMAAYPDVQVLLHLQDRFVDLIEEGMDLAVRIGKLPPSGLVARKLADCQLMACASPTYLSSSPPPRQPADLSEHPLIGYLGDVTTAQWTFIDDRGQTIELQPRCRFLANNTGMMAAVAAQGAGIAYGPKFAFARYLATGALVQVLPAYRHPVLPLHALTPTAKHVNVKTRLLIDRLKAVLTDPTLWDPESAHRRNA